MKLWKWLGSLAIIVLVFFCGMVVGFNLPVEVVEVKSVRYEALPGSIWAQAGVPVAVSSKEILSESEILIEKLKEKGFVIKEGPYKYMWTIERKSSQ